MTINTPSQPGSLVERLTTVADNQTWPETDEAPHLMREAASRIAELERERDEAVKAATGLKASLKTCVGRSGSWKDRAVAAEATLLALREKYEGAAQSQPCGAPESAATDAEPSAVAVFLAEREDGGLRVWSDDVLGLILSGRDPVAVGGDIWPAIKVIRAAMAIGAATASPTGGQLGPGNPSNPSDTALRNHLLGKGKEDE